MPPFAIVGIIVVGLLVLWAVVGGGKRDKAVAQASKNAAAFQQRAAMDPDWGLTETARSFGLALDLPADKISASGQAAGRFTGSRLEVETLGDLGRNKTLRNIALLGVIGAMMPATDEREMYLTVTGDGFQLAARVPASSRTPSSPRRKRNCSAGRRIAPGNAGLQPRGAHCPTAARITFTVPPDTVQRSRPIPTASGLAAAIDPLPDCTPAELWAVSVTAGWKFPAASMTSRNA